MWNQKYDVVILRSGTSPSNEIGKISSTEYLQTSGVKSYKLALNVTIIDFRIRALFLLGFELESTCWFHTCGLRAMCSYCGVCSSDIQFPLNKGLFCVNDFVFEK